MILDTSNEKVAITTLLNNFDVITHAINNNNAVIEINDDSDLLVKNLKKAELGYYDKSGFRIYSHVIDFINFYEKKF